MLTTIVPGAERSGPCYGAAAGGDDRFSGGARLGAAYAVPRVS